VNDAQKAALQALLNDSPSSSPRPAPTPAAKPLGIGQPARGGVPLGIALLVFGSLLWVAGARYTVDGWVTGLNWVLTWMGMAERLETLTGWSLIGVAFVVGLIYSWVEVKGRPFWRIGGVWRFAAADAWLGWLLLVASDVLTTYAGAQVVAADAWSITRTIAGNVFLAFGWALILTFIPEWLIGGSVRHFRRQ
jgi:hypothetical protein